MAKLKIFGIVLLFIACGVLLFHDQLYNWAALVKHQMIGEQPSSTYTPTPTVYTPGVSSPPASASASPTPHTLSLSPTIVLDVPFLVQAPNANWDALHEEACEEASLLNVFYFIKGKKAANRDVGESEIQDMVAYEKSKNYEDSITLAQLNQKPDKTLCRLKYSAYPSRE